VLLACTVRGGGMKQIFNQEQAQSFLEYVILIAVVAAALITMNTYMRRSINARLSAIQEEMSESRR
jgi:Flp pilus assembly pilin Flp